MKLLGIGFGRTGTTSLTSALRKLGYATTHFDTGFLGLLRGAAQTGVLDLSRYDHLDALTDQPTCLFYREFGERYPDLKYLLTVRDETDWLASVIGHTAKYRVGPSDDRYFTRQLVFGTEFPNRLLMRRKYLEHNQAVIRDIPPDRLLVMDICAGDGWEKLCPFLGAEVPSVAFPWENRT